MSGVVVAHQKKSGASGIIWGAIQAVLGPVFPLTKVTVWTLVKWVVFANVLKFMACRMKRQKTLKNKLVLVTGGGGGIGREFALEFAKQGSRVVLWDINQAALDETRAVVQEKYPHSEVHCHITDITRREVVMANAARVLEDLGPVYCLVNNAGLVGGASILDSDEKRVVKTFEINSISHFWTVQAFLPAMLAAKPGGSGHIVTIASAASYFSAPRMVDYSASKFAARGFADGLRAELKKMGATGVDTTCVCPGHVNTAMFQGFSGFLVPSLQPAEVAKKTVAAVRRGQAQLILPWICTIAVVLQSFLPPRVMDALQDLTANTSGAMDSFKSDHTTQVLSMMEGAK